MMRALTVILLILLESLASAQDEISWKAEKQETMEALELFHSTHSINLPTAETIQKNNLEFEISHRFIPLIRSGSENLYGFDGPVNMRLSLSYGLTDNIMIALGRSNSEDNLDLSLKYNFFQIPSQYLPAVAAIRGGMAWNTQVIERKASDARNFQYFAQLAVNTMYGRRLALGIVPSYLYNSYIYARDYQYSFTIGTHIQYYLSPMFSTLAEWNFIVTGFRTHTNPVAFGLEIETGGHFFKIIVTNSQMINTSQFLAGADKSFNNGEWRLGFNITRMLQL